MWGSSLTDSYEYSTPDEEKLDWMIGALKQYRTKWYTLKMELFKALHVSLAGISPAFEKDRMECDNLDA
ncbi:hypothetical protein FRC02_008772 [Tulasnella sp. 418]|nr:hypothetical protein FRC02_008772 [Tulasnella sp. 418]